MQKLAEVCVRRPVFAVMLILAMVVIGAVSYTKLGVDRFPDVDLPIVTVRTSLIGAAPEEIESTVTRRIEDAVATVEGIDQIRSTSTEGVSSTIEPGYRAVSVQITDVSGVAGLIQPNAKVDVIFTRPGSMAEATTSTILQNVKVLSTGRSLQTGQPVDARAPHRHRVLRAP